MVSPPPAPRSAAVQCSVCVGAVPVIVQFCGAASIDQFTPGPPGNASSITTFFATPGPPFFALIVKPICEPASTVPLSAVFVRVRDGHCTVVPAVSSIGKTFDPLSD